MSRTALARLLATSVALLAACVSYVFVSNLNPASDKTPPTPSTLIVSISSLKPDSYIDIEWNNRPVFIYRPGPVFVSTLSALNLQTSSRSLSSAELPSIFVYYPLSPLGCKLVEKGKGEIDETWLGGWLDPCHGGTWDYSGRRIYRADGDTKISNLPISELAIPRFRLIDGGSKVELL